MSNSKPNQFVNFDLIQDRPTWPISLPIGHHRLNVLSLLAVQQPETKESAADKKRKPADKKYYTRLDLDVTDSEGKRFTFVYVAQSKAEFDEIFKPCFDGNYINPAKNKIDRVLTVDVDYKYVKLPDGEITDTILMTDDGKHEQKNTVTKWIALQAKQPAKQPAKNQKVDKKKVMTPTE